MDFSNLNDIERYLSSLKRISYGEFLDGDYLSSDEFQPIDCGHFIVHISAGKNSLSTPNNNIYNRITDYSHLQVIIQENIKGSESIQVIKPAEDNRFANLEWSNLFKYKDYLGKNHETYLGKTIPIKNLLQIIKDCYKLSRLKIFF